MSEPIVIAGGQGYLQVGLNSAGQPICEIKVVGDNVSEVIAKMESYTQALPAIFKGMTTARYGAKPGELK